MAVVLVSVVFILIRLLLPIKFDGSLVDEYWHITSGLSLFETGNYAYFYDNGKPYDRGLLMSLWVASWLTLFGKSITIAKLAPISIAIINYFLFLYLTLKLVDKRKFQLLALLLFTSSPWIIFSHFYIRFYVVNEMFLLVLLVLGYKLYKANRDEKWISVSLFLFLIILLNFMNLALTRVQSEYMLLFASGVMLAALFVYEFNTEAATKNRLFSAISRSVWLSNRVYRALIVLAVALFGLIVLDGSSKFEFLLNASLEYSSFEGYKYPWLFWEKNSVITAFFVFASATFFWKSAGYERVLLLIAGLIFIIHTVSSVDLQIVRGITYFLPVYYLVAVIGMAKVFSLSALRDRTEWLWYIVISSVFLALTLTNVSRAFYSGPEIKFEVFYIEYERLYSAVNKNCQGNLIVEAGPMPFIAKFHGVDVDYVLSAVVNKAAFEQYKIDANTGKVVTIWGEIPVLTDMNSLKSLDRDTCLVIRSPSKKRFYPPSAEGMLESADKTWRFHNIDLYLLKHEILLDGNK